MIGVSLLNRGVARSIDLVLALAIADVLPRAGWIAAVLYVLVADGVMNGQSIGKMVLGLRVLNSEGEPCGIKDSILRNALLGIGVFLWNIPLLGWLMLLGAVGIELLVLVGSKSGLRLGDELAKTSVVYAGKPGDEDTDEDTKAEATDEDDHS